ncbi:MULTISPECIES: hypothetical protein [unclassified Variovorax]|uniref:hypothetical protein n=1 Tax=unclassified Variovorax TaxID=663243 RepID=UPI0008386B0D|nr:MULTISPECIES: hypothetical protein [unclassified Variovorax]PNG48833.1 hypothetical protein CHC06_06601 [Variovorax sp. B2]PNG49340.1 hypothetical protein CHC07_06249 [Variovorax sp. B4]VTV18370.1 hypothetical protein WDL1P2_00075 [Variovorax sp. WDL1]
MSSIQAQSKPLTVVAARMLSADEISDLAYIEACELDSPNSPDFDRLRDSIEERMQDEQSSVAVEAPRG